MVRLTMPGRRALPAVWMFIALAAGLAGFPAAAAEGPAAGEQVAQGPLADAHEARARSGGAQEAQVRSAAAAASAARAALPEAQTSAVDLQGAGEPVAQAQVHAAQGVGALLGGPRVAAVADAAVDQAFEALAQLDAPMAGKEPEPVEHARGVASWYGPGLHGRRTASGERFDQHALTAAHRSLPFGTEVRVENLRTGRAVDVRINDRGPFAHRSRIIDLSMAAGRALGLGRAAGLAPVRITILRRPRR